MVLLIPRVLYRCETWALVDVVQKRLNMLEMKNSLTICGVRRFNQLRNERARERCASEKRTVKRAEEGLLKWCKHMERMDDD